MEALQINDNLIIRIADGDKDAFRELYSLTASAVYGFALSILKNRQDAEDVMHDTYIRIYSSAASYRSMGSPLAWILTIVRNLCYNRIRAAGKHEDVEEIERLADEGSQEDHSAAILDRMILNDALRILDEEERQIVILHSVTGMKHREIGEIMNAPVGTVLSKYKRALGKMRKHIEGKGGRS